MIPAEPHRFIDGHLSMPDPDRPLVLRAWRNTKSESAFVGELKTWRPLNEDERQAAAFFHHATFFWLSFIADSYRVIRESDLPVGTVSPTDPLVRRLQRQLWAFLQSAKAVLDSLGREINLVYWALDPLKRFFNPLVKMRWTTFYTVREKLLREDEFRDDPLGQLLQRKTKSEAADQVYLDLSHLINLSLIGPPTIGRVEVSGPSREGVVKVSEAGVFLPDDPRRWPVTYERGLEVNRLFQESLAWLEILSDDVYDTLHIKLRSER